MGIDKRSFLKITGLSALGAGLGSKLARSQPTDIVKHDDRALKGGRWAMVIDTSKCPKGCDDCTSACHATHNVPDFISNPDESVNNERHEIKWIWHDHYEHVFAVPEADMRTVAEDVKEREMLVLCNHCDNPPCVRACPTKATFKRESDGIVMMDYHRCIGCRFCMAACPFGARSFNYRDPRAALDMSEINKEFPTRMRGVVEKCNFCAERLAAGKMPACVEACQHGGMIFGDLDDPNSNVSKKLKESYAIKRKPELGTLPMVYYIV